uniref:SH3 domain-containing protein n=1 Tax=Leptobrachium leishanense TaxID=445787 RepID=A0A8C5QZT6_9ANUR
MNYFVLRIMARCAIIITLVALSIAKLEGQKILSEKKKCGDPRCERVMIRAQANQDYNGPDCRYLTFKSGDEVNVFYKLSGKREDLWQGSTGKAYGFFFKDTVNVEEVYLTDEFEVPAQEIDFVCLDGGDYVFENEDSVLHKNRLSEDLDKSLDSKLTGDSARKHPDNGVIKNREADFDPQVSDQDLPKKAFPEKQSWVAPDIARWFGFGKNQERVEKDFEVQPVEADTLHTKEPYHTMVSDLKELGQGQTEETGWFGRRIRKFLPFVEKEATILSKQDDSLLEFSNSNGIINTKNQESNERKTETIEKTEEIKASNSHSAPSKWYNFGFNKVLGLEKRDEPKKPEDEHEIDESMKNESMEMINPSQTEPNGYIHSSQSQATDDLDVSKENYVSTQRSHSEVVTEKLEETPFVGSELPHGLTNLISEVAKGELLPDYSDIQTCSIASEICNDFPDEKMSQFHQKSPENYKSDLLTQKVENPHFQEQTFDESSAFGFMSVTDVITSWDKIYSSLLDIHLTYVKPSVSVTANVIYKVFSSLPDNLQPGTDFYDCSWDVVLVTALLGLLSTFVFTCRAVKSVKSRFYSRREHKLGEKIVEALNEKSEVLEKLSLFQKQYEEVEESLRDSEQQKILTEIADHKVLMGQLQNSNSALEENLSKLEQELEAEKSVGSELQESLDALNEKIQGLEEKFKKEKSEKEATRTTLKVFEINQARLETSFQDVLQESSHLQESIKQLSKEAEGWEERFSELSENSCMLSSSVEVIQEDLNHKQTQIKSLIDSLLRMKDWSSEVDDANETEDNSIPNITLEFENGEHLGDPQKRTIKKLIYVAMLNASLRGVEAEKLQLYDNLSDEMKAKEQLHDCINGLQNAKQSLSTENQHLESEVETLKQKISVMSEMYQENETKLHRKLTLQENERIQKEEKLSKMDEKINMTAGELLNVKTRVKELEEEVEKTISSYQNQVISYEKKSHDNWLTAREAERQLSDIKKETAHLRQKLTDAEYKMEILEKDPFAVDAIHLIGRAHADVYLNHQENSPYGPSYHSRLQENRPFLSPPTLLEGPLRISPMLPGADRGARSPGYYPAFLNARDPRDVNADRKADHQRTLSDAGSLSPPWDGEQKISLPPPESVFYNRRPERFYLYPSPSGRFSGPAELTRNQGKPFMDVPNGSASPEYKPNRNGTEDNDNSPGSPRPPKEGESMEAPPIGYTGLPPPPFMRMPMLPIDSRGPYFRRSFPMPPVEMFGPPTYPGMPPIHHSMRSPMPAQHYPPFPVHGDQSFPAPHLRPVPRNDLPPLSAPTSESMPDPSSENKT